LKFIGYIFAFSVAACCAAQTSTESPSPRLSTLSREFKDLARKVNPSVVRVSSLGYRPLDEDESDDTGVASKQRSSGSGVIISADGYIVTNAHVVLGAQKVQVTLLVRGLAEPGKSGALETLYRKALKADLVGLDLETDVALLRVNEKGLQSLRLADSDAVEQGELVWAFGSPMGLDNSVSMGVVSSTARQFKPDDPMVYLQTDASINPGNSGGPVVDANGDVVGISTLILTQGGGSEGLGFAVPSNVVSNVVEQLRATGKVVRGDIGVVVQTVTPALAHGWNLPRESGVVIADVDPESEGARAGLQIGDIIRSLNGRLVDSARQLNVGLYRPARGATVRLDVLRGTDNLRFDVKVREKGDDFKSISEWGSREENLIPELGIFAVNISAAMRDQVGPTRFDRGGVLVAAREADGLAVEDNFESGDLIEALNRERVKDVNGLRSMLKKLKSGDPVAVQIERQGRLRFISFELP
jgi:serine protease Do